MLDEKSVIVIKDAIEEWEKTWSQWEKQGQKPVEGGYKPELDADALTQAEASIRKLIYGKGDSKAINLFVKSYEAAWDKLDDDLFNTARLYEISMCNAQGKTDSSTGSPAGYTSTSQSMIVWLAISSNERFANGVYL